jgi:hypothetical protein
MSDFATRYQVDGGRGLSPKVWANCPRTAINNGHLDKGWGFVDDFVSKDELEHYTATQATAGTFALDDAKGGVVLADCGSTTATQGINVQRATTVGECFNAQYGKLYFEALIKAADIATGPEFFLGLAVIDTTVIATSALSAQSIGFSSVTDDGVLLSGTKDGTSAATGTGTTLVADTWVKLGFIAHENSKVDFYVDGVKVNTETTYIPTTEMVPTLVCQSGGTTDPIVHVDWIACFQVESLTR